MFYFLKCLSAQNDCTTVIVSETFGVYLFMCKYITFTIYSIYSNFTGRHCTYVCGAANIIYL